MILADWRISPTGSDSGRNRSLDSLPIGCRDSIRIAFVGLRLAQVPGRAEPHFPMTPEPTGPGVVSERDPPISTLQRLRLEVSRCVGFYRLEERIRLHLPMSSTSFSGGSCARAARAEMGVNCRAAGAFHKTPAAFRVTKAPERRRGARQSDHIARGDLQEMHECDALSPRNRAHWINCRGSAR